jgi:hypothetical protein
VLRRERGAWECGWPWRWQVALENDGGLGARGLSAADADWAFEQAQRAGGGARTRVFLPVVGDVAHGAVRGTTLVKGIMLPDDALMLTLDPEKRRVVRKLERLGWQVIEASTAEHLRAFQQLQLDNESRLGRGASVRLTADPPPGMGWREWEQPWQWLLLAVHEGVIRAGSGYGRAEQGMVDYRANASTPEGRKAGANTLLGWHAIRRARDAGLRWMNWGGNTPFKQELGGETILVENRLGGGALWAVPNQIETTVARTRSTLAAWVKEARARQLSRRKA